MAERTRIEWADHTFNPWIGCTKVSNGEKGACENCYAEVWGNRFGVPWGQGAPRRRTSEANWRQPLAWDRAAAKAGERPFVFCASLADILDNEVPIEWLADVIDLARRTPNLIWLFLTKRAPLIVKRIREALAVLGLAKMPSNIAFGISVVTQEEADRDIPHLLAAKIALGAVLAFVSMEPLMEFVDLTRISTMRFRGAEVLNALTGELSGMFGDPCATRLPPLDWVITGGESGARARITPAGAFEAIRDQCVRASVAYHHKQNGEWVSAGRAVFTRNDRARPSLLPDHTGKWAVAYGPETMIGDFVPIYHRIGKDRAGRLLDGRTWDELPKVEAAHVA